MLESILPVFVEFIPRELEEGVLYISEKYKTATHLCCCGCGTKIVTPFRNTEYRLTTSGQIVSIYPSIGNWNHPCQTHYWIRNNQIIQASKMSKEEILLGRAYDDKLKEEYFNKLGRTWLQRSISRIQQFLTRIFN